MFAHVPDHSRVHDLGVRVDGPAGEWPRGTLVTITADLPQGHHLGLYAFGALPFWPLLPGQAKQGEGETPSVPFSSDSKPGNQGRVLVEVHLSLFGFKFPTNVQFAFSQEDNLLRDHQKRADAVGGTPPW